MGIASFSPQFGRTTALSVLLSPIQALVALFVPAPATFAPTCLAVSPIVACRITAYSRNMVNSTRINSARPTVAVAPVQRLKIVRQFEPGANRSCAGRLFISGRMADVCAELERMAG